MAEQQVTIVVWQSVLWIRIYWIRIRIQHFKLIRVLMTKNLKNTYEKIFFSWSKIASYEYLSRDLHKGHPSIGEAFSPQKITSRTWNLFPFSYFCELFSLLDPYLVQIRIPKTGGSTTALDEITTWRVTKDDVHDELELVELPGEEDVEVVEGVPVGPEGGLPHTQQPRVQQQEHTQGHHQQHCTVQKQYSIKASLKRYCDEKIKG